MADRFNEETLLSDVIAKWGAFGAHADLTRWMIAEIERLRATVQDLRMHLEQDACEIERLRADRDAWRKDAHGG